MFGPSSVGCFHVACLFSKPFRSAPRPRAGVRPTSHRKRTLRRAMGSPARRRPRGKTLVKTEVASPGRGAAPAAVKQERKMTSSRVAGRHPRGSRKVEWQKVVQRYRLEGFAGGAQFFNDSFLRWRANGFEEARGEFE